MTRFMTLIHFLNFDISLVWSMVYLHDILSP